MAISLSTCVGPCKDSPHSWHLELVDEMSGCVKARRQHLLPSVQFCIHPAMPDSSDLLPDESENERLGKHVVSSICDQVPAPFGRKASCLGSASWKSRKARLALGGYPNDNPRSAQATQVASFSVAFFFWSKFAGPRPFRALPWSNGGICERAG
jgi:hypothetical protein